VRELRLERARRAPGVTERLRVVSDSMQPTVRKGEAVEARLGAGLATVLAFGDLVVYADTTGQAVVHRVFGRRRYNGRPVVLEAGDANWSGSRLPADRVIGTVLLIHTSFGTINIRCRLARWLGTLAALIVGGSIGLGRKCPPSRRFTCFPRRTFLRLHRGLLLRLCRVRTECGP